MGSICTACDHRSVRSEGRCERCLGTTASATFGPHGTVWAATTVHLRVGERTPPFVLAYVDLDDGPRILATVDSSEKPVLGARVRISGDRDGDVLVEESR